MSSQTAATAIAAVAVFLAAAAGQAQARGVACGDEIKKDTTLHADLRNCGRNGSSPDGLVIAADDITLDLNGHTIDGVQAGERDCNLQATGVSNPAGHDGVTIQNGTVREFGHGIGGGFGRSRMRNLTVRDNRGAGIVIGAPAGDDIDANEITRNQFVRNGCAGLRLFGVNHFRIAGNRLADGGMDLYGFSHGVVEHNVVSGGDGIVAGFGASFNRIEHNAVSGSRDGIFLIDSSDNNRISENATSGNFFGGIAVRSSSHNRVTSNSSMAEPAGVGLEFAQDEGSPDANVVSGNRSVRDGIGVLVLGSDENQIVGNRAVEPVEHAPGFPLTGGFGIQVDSGSENVIADNTVDRPERDGIQLVATPDWGGVAAGNLLRWNVVRGAGGDGVRVDSSATDSLLEGNLVVRAADDGFDVAGSATLTRNRAFRNGSFGIRAAVGVTDGGGNRARGNGEPEQCTSTIACA
jgi:parallel beta-helix repeat protein